MKIIKLTEEEHKFLRDCLDDVYHREMELGNGQDFENYGDAQARKYLDDGTILTPRSDDEGNESGAILTNLKDLSCIPTFREELE